MERENNAVENKHDTAMGLLCIGLSLLGGIAGSMYSLVLNRFSFGMIVLFIILGILAGFSLGLIFSAAIYYRMGGNNHDLVGGLFSFGFAVAGGIAGGIYGFETERTALTIFLFVLLWFVVGFFVGVIFAIVSGKRSGFGWAAQLESVSQNDVEQSADLSSTVHMPPTRSTDTEMKQLQTMLKNGLISKKEFKRRKNLLR